MPGGGRREARDIQVGVRRPRPRSDRSRTEVGRSGLKATTGISRCVSGKTRLLNIAYWHRGLDVETTTWSRGSCNWDRAGVILASLIVRVRLCVGVSVWLCDSSV